MKSSCQCMEDVSVLLGSIDDYLVDHFYCFRATQTSFGRAEDSIWHGIRVRSEISP